MSATVASLTPDHLLVRWSPYAAVTEIEGFLLYLLEVDGLRDAGLTPHGPSLVMAVDESSCRLTPGRDLWSMIYAEEVAARLVRSQKGEVLDGSGNVLAAYDVEESRPWAALEAVGVISLFRPRPPDVPDVNSHPLIPLEDCKVTGVNFTQERECLLDVYFDYWARPCAFLLEEGQTDLLLYRPMYRYRQAIFGPSDLCRVSIQAPPTSRIYGALGVQGYKVGHHHVTTRGTWTIKGQEDDFFLRTQTTDAWLTRSSPLWYQVDPLLLSVPTDREFSAEELLQRKEQHWDITDSEWNQEWYVAAREDGTPDPLGRIYRADLTTALLDLPGLKPLIR